MIRLLLFFALLPSLATAGEILSFKWEKKQVYLLNRKTLGKAPLQVRGREISEKKIKIYDKVAKEEKVYQGFLLSDIFSAIYGRKWKESYKVKYAASDGYRVSNQISNIISSIEKGYVPYLVYKEADKEGFSPFKKGRKTIELGPFYVVWTNFKPGRIKDKVLRKLKWPYQIKEIDFKLMRPRRRF